MRKLLILVAVLALAFAGYWFAGARALEAGLGQWLDQRAAEGWVAERSDISTGGFPMRFETVVSDLQLADPDTGLAWTAPAFTILAQSHKPNRFTAIWPAEQILATPFERITATSARMDASLEVVPGTALELRDIGMDLADLALGSTSGWRVSLARGHLSARADAEADFTYDIAFEATGVVPPDEVRRDLDPTRLFPDVIEGLTLDARATFDRPWDRFAIETARPQFTRINLRDLRAQWGPMEIRAAGELAVDQRGRPEGEITVKAKDWRAMLDMARTTGAVPVQILPTLERALELLAGLSGPPDTLDVPLTFRKGVVLFGPIPIGPAPDLTIR